MVLVVTYPTLAQIQSHFRLNGIPYILMDVPGLLSKTAPFCDIQMVQRCIPRTGLRDVHKCCFWVGCWYITLYFRRERSLSCMLGRSFYTIETELIDTPQTTLIMGYKAGENLNVYQ